MLQRTWEYGSTKSAECIDFVSGAIILTDEDGEGHVLMGTGNILPSKGDKVTIEFTEGGPTGGYWKITSVNN